MENGCLKERQAASFLNISIATLRRYRAEGVGPVYIKTIRAVRYDAKDLAEYVERHKVKTQD
jgi:hypothetical protein